MNTLNLSFPQELAPLPNVSVTDSAATTVPPETSSADHDTLNIYGVGGIAAVSAILYVAVKRFRDGPKPNAESDARTFDDYLGKRKR